MRNLLAKRMVSSRAVRSANSSSDGLYGGSSGSAASSSSSSTGWPLWKSEWLVSKSKSANSSGETSTSQTTGGSCDCPVLHAMSDAGGRDTSGIETTTASQSCWHEKSSCPCGSPAFEKPMDFKKGIKEERFTLITQESSLMETFLMLPTVSITLHSFLTMYLSHNGGFPMSSSSSSSLSSSSSAVELVSNSSSSRTDSWSAKASASSACSTMSACVCEDMRAARLGASKLHPSESSARSVTVALPLNMIAIAVCHHQ
mmetsp:Transcript_4597/g.10041  ORF Transcript_4597/g.10041 Transcript_4597/m.10041 type:complete len:258 (+) Transcript_4597:533-1306(+)